MNEFAQELRPHLDFVAVTDHMKCGFSSRLSRHVGSNDEFMTLPGMEVNFRLEPPFGFAWSPEMTKILLVEDNESHRTILVQLLRGRNYELEIAVDGEQGLEKAQAENPNLILMDLSLPGLDGWEVVRRLKSGEATRHIPIIAITAFALNGAREKVLETGCDGYIPKPVEFSELLKQMQGLL